MILANGCNITKSEQFKGVWILSVPTVYIYIYESESDVTYSQVCWHILGIRALHFTHPSAHTQQWTHTHTVNTQREQWTAIYAVAHGEQLEVWRLAQGHLVVVLKVERVLYIHSHIYYYLPWLGSKLHSSLWSPIISKLNGPLYGSPSRS